MLSIQTDVNSLNIQNNLGVNNASMQTAVQRLSSGFRINSAADDSAGYAIAANLSKTNASLQAGTNNAMQASAMLNIANAGVNQIKDMLVRLQTLATEAASGNNSSAADANLNTEAGKLITEINNIASSTSYNGVNLLDGTGGSSLTIQVGDTNDRDPAGDAGSVHQVHDRQLRRYWHWLAGVALSSLDISTQSGATAALGTLSTAMTRSVDGSCQAGCVGEPAELRQLVSVLGNDADVVCDLHDQGRQHGAGNGQLHQVLDPGAGRNVHAGPDQAGRAERPVSVPVIGA